MYLVNNCLSIQFFQDKENKLVQNTKVVFGKLEDNTCTSVKKWGELLSY